MKKNPIRIIALAAAAFVVLVILSIVFTLRSHRSETFSQEAAVANNFSNVAPYGNDSLVLSNGRAFVAYNYNSGQSTLLGSDDANPSLNDIDQLSASADKNYLLFHESSVTPGSTLEGLLNQKSLDTARDYWWLYNVSHKTYTLFPTTVNTVNLHGNTAYALVREVSNSTIHLATYRLSDLQQTNSFAVPSSNSFFVTNDHFVLQSSDNKVLSTKDGVVNNQILSGTTLLSVNSEGTIAAGITDQQEGGGSLVRFDLQHKSQKTIEEGVTDYVASNDQNIVLYGIKDGDTETSYIYNALTDQKRMLKFDKKSPLSKSASPIEALTDQVAVLRDQSNNMHLAGKDIHAVKSLSSFTTYSTPITVGNNVVDLEFSPDDSAFIAIINDQTASAEKQAVYDQLRKYGFDPNLLDVRLTSYTQNAGASNPGPND